MNPRSAPHLALLLALAGATAGAEAQQVTGMLAARTLPIWFEGDRVHAHTRFLRRHFEADPVRFVNVAGDFKRVGAEAYTRTFKARGEGAWWQTQIGPEFDAMQTGRNLAQEMVQDAQRNNMRIIAYYRHFEEDSIVANNPDWVVRNIDGSMARSPRSPYISFLSPFAQFTRQRLVELAGLGVNGIYFDEVHQPPTGNFSAMARDRYRAETGRALPTTTNNRDQAFNDFIDWNNQVITRTFANWVPAIKAVNPQCMVLISAARWNSWGVRHLEDDLFNYADSVKIEYNAGLRRGNNNAFYRDLKMARVPQDVRNVLAWAVARDVVDGRPPHIWASGLSDERSMQSATAAMLAAGAIANLDIKEAALPDMRFASSFEMGDKTKDIMQGARPMQWFGVVYSRRAWNARKTDEVRAWKEVFWPVTGAWMTAYRRGMPVSVLFDRHLNEGIPSNYRAVYVPNPGDLSSTQRANLNAFRSRGGIVIEDRASINWHQSRLQGNCERVLLRALAAAGNPPVEVDGGHPLQVTGIFQKPGVTIVGIAVDASWVYVGAEEFPGDDADISGAYPGAISGATVVLRRSTAPRSVREVISGRVLTPRQQNGAWVVDVPTFPYLAMLEIRD